MSGYVCVTTLVEHMVTQSKKLFVGTTAQDDWYFYHDALTSLKDKDTVAWMIKHNYLKHWIVPMHDLNK